MHAQPPVNVQKGQYTKAKERRFSQMHADKQHDVDSNMHEEAPVCNTAGQYVTPTHRDAGNQPQASQTPHIKANGRRHYQVQQSTATKALRQYHETAKIGGQDRRRRAVVV
jgi:hypothetical protein